MLLTEVLLLCNGRRSSTSQMKGALGKHRWDTKRGRDHLTPTNSDIKKMTPIVEKQIFTVKLQRIQIQTLTDDCLRSILTNAFQMNRSCKQQGPVSLKPQIKAIQALQKSEMGRGYLHVSSLVYVYTAITQDTFTPLCSQCYHYVKGWRMWPRIHGHHRSNCPHFGSPILCIKGFI